MSTNAVPYELHQWTPIPIIYRKVVEVETPESHKLIQTKGRPENFGTNCGIHLMPRISDILQTLFRKSEAIESIFSFQIDLSTPDMESEGSNNDSLMHVDEAELIEEYEASKWHDKSCAELIEESNVHSASRLCHACRDLLSGRKVFQNFYKHYYYLSSFISAADRGCHLWGLTRSKIAGKPRFIDLLRTYG